MIQYSQSKNAWNTKNSVIAWRFCEIWKPGSKTLVRKNQDERITAPELINLKSDNKDVKMAQDVMRDFIKRFDSETDEHTVF